MEDMFVFILSVSGDQQHCSLAWCQVLPQYVGPLPLRLVLLNNRLNGGAQDFPNQRHLRHAPNRLAYGTEAAGAGHLCSVLISFPETAISSTWDGGYHVRLGGRYLLKNYSMMKTGVLEALLYRVWSRLSWIIHCTVGNELLWSWTWQMAMTLVRSANENSIWMGIPTCNLLIPTECKHQKKSTFPEICIGYVLAGSWPVLSQQRRIHQTKYHWGNVELFLDSGLVESTLGPKSWGKLAENSKHHPKQDGGTPILPWWLAAKVYWL